MKVTVSRRRVNGKPGWCVDWREPGHKRQRRFFQSESAAISQAESIRLQLRNTGDDWYALSDADRFELISVWHAISKEGLTVRAVWDGYKATPRNGSGPLLSDLIVELITTKRNAGRHKRTLASLKSVLNQFAGENPSSTIGAIGLPEIERFLDARALLSRATNRSKLSTMFKFAVRRGYRFDNPCERLESVRVVRPPPAIFTVEQTGIALDWFRKEWPRALPWFVLSTFCGLRPEEALQTTRADIHFDEGWIKVEAQTTKVRQRRIVYPKSEALELLRRSLKKGKLPLHPQSRRRAIRRLRDKLGFDKWPKDITRHTAASYWLADSVSAATVAEQLGHSETVLKRHYKALVTREQAKAFWQLAASFLQPRSHRN